MIATILIAQNPAYRATFPFAVLSFFILKNEKKRPFWTIFHA